MGFGADASPARACHFAGRWTIAGWHPLDHLPPRFFLPVKVLSRLFRRRFLKGLASLHKASKLAFFGDLARLSDPNTFAAHFVPLGKTDWGVYAKPPFCGPEAVLAYLSRYTHRVAISNHRMISADADIVAFRWRDYRVKRGDPLPLGSGTAARRGLEGHSQEGRTALA